MTRTGEAEIRLRAAIERGTDEDLRAWAATGHAGLLLLRQELSAQGSGIGAAASSRDAIDNMSAAVAAIAAEHPDAFLEVFADPDLDLDSFVVTGLGQIDDPRATERLVRAARSADASLRMHAAIGLGRRVSPLAVEALTSLLADLEYFVRYHALKSLTKVGDAEALVALHGFAPETAYEGELARAAIDAIEARALG